VPLTRPACNPQVKKFFRPEFLNRLDDIVVFDPLSAHQLLGVARLMAEELNDRLKPKNITLKMTDNALQFAVSQVGCVVWLVGWSTRGIVLSYCAVLLSTA
jgi:ATP-dependent Clp protease ATP-binding subunit ClpA